MRTRQKLTLPSGGTCVVRALSAMDWLAMPRKPQAFPQSSNAQEPDDDALDAKRVEETAAMLEAIIVRCCSPITWGDERKRIVIGKDLDELGDDEITLEELSQDDANAIVAASAEVNSLTKEAGDSVGSFPEGSDGDGEHSSVGENLRGVAEPDPGA